MVEGSAKAAAFVTRGNGLAERLTDDITSSVFTPGSRRAQFQTAERLRQSFAEHENIVKAIERGESDEAAALMRHHMRPVEAALEGRSSS